MLVIQTIHTTPTQVVMTTQATKRSIQPSRSQLQGRWTPWDCRLIETVAREEGSSDLQDHALLPLVLLCQESRTGGRLEHFTDALIGSRGTFQIFICPNLFANLLTLKQSVRNGKLVTRLARLEWQHTCSGVTGFWDVLCNSSMVRGSWRRSFLQPTRMMGWPWQKWRTSEIHWWRQIGQF